MNRTRKIGVVIGVLLGVSLLTGLDAMLGGLRFVSSRANDVVGFTASWLPLVCVILLTRLPRSRVRLLGFVALIPLAAYSVLGGIGDATGESAFPATVKCESSIPFGYTQIVIYFTDEGGTDEGSFFVQQEIKLLPGLLWVRPVFNKDGADNISLKAINSHHVECDYEVVDPDTLEPSPAKRDVIWVF